MKRIFYSVLLSLLFCNLLHAQNGYQPYGFIRKIELGGNEPGGYLKMDGDRERLFVTRSNKVQVIDLKTYTKVSELTGLKGAVGNTLAKNVNKVYAANADDNTLSIFDYTDYKALGSIKISGKPSSLVYNNPAKELFVFTPGSKSVVIVDCVNDKEIKNLPLGGKPVFALSNGGNLVYITLEDTNEIAIVDTRTNEIIKRFNLGVNKGPTGITRDEVSNAFFVTCKGSKTLAIIDGNTGSLIQSMPVGTSPDGVIFTKLSQLVIVSNGDGTVTIAKQKDPFHYEFLQTLNVKKNVSPLVHRGASKYLFFSGADTQNGAPVPNSFGVFIYGQPSEK